MIFLQMKTNNYPGYQIKNKNQIIEEQRNPSNRHKKEHHFLEKNEFSGISKFEKALIFD